MMHNLDWDNLRFVLAVAEAGSLNAAAKRLGVNHATILRRIAALEDELGCVIFDKSARGYRPNAGGSNLVAAIRSVAEAVSKVERVAAGEDVGLSGKVRLTSTDTICQCILPPHLAAFRDQYPEILIEVSSTNKRLDLARLDADIAIRPARQLPLGLKGKAVTTIDLRVFGSPGYLSRNLSPEAHHHRWLAPAGSVSASASRQQGLEPPTHLISARADSYLTLASLAQCGMGLAMLPVCIGDIWDGLERAPLTIAAQYPIWVASHSDLADVGHIQTALRYFEEALGKEDRFRA